MKNKIELKKMIVALPYELQTLDGELDDKTVSQIPADLILVGYITKKGSRIKRLFRRGTKYFIPVYASSEQQEKGQT